MLSKLELFRIMSIKIKTRRLRARKKETKDYRYINNKFEVFIREELIERVKNSQNQKK